MKTVLIIVSSIIGVLVIGFIALAIWVSDKPTAGVKMSNELAPAELKYLADHKVLEPDEKVIVYYDTTVGVDSTESALITTRRVLYQVQGHTTGIELAHIKSVTPSKDAIGSTVLVIEADSGETMKIEIAPLNGGDLFKTKLDERWKAAKTGGG